MRNNDSPWGIGWESVKANALPAVVLWSLAAALVAAYYAVPGVQGLLAPVADLLAAGGAWGGFASLAFYLGALPGVVFLFARKLRPERPFATCVAQTLWNGFLGVCCHYFFIVQDALFGTGNGFGTLAAKTAFDQFVWTAFVIAPANAVFYFWASRGFSFRRTRRDWPKGFFRHLVLPNLLMNWCVGIPNNFAAYSFPTPLRIQVIGILGAFWVLVCLQIGKRSGRSAAE